MTNDPASLANVWVTSRIYCCVPLAHPQVKKLEPNYTFSGLCYIVLRVIHPAKVNRSQVHSGDSRPARSKVTGQLIILTFYDTYI